MYSIKQVANRLHCSSNAIRYYEEQGLLVPKRSDNGYRSFSEEDISRLQFIILYRKLGFSINSIQQLCQNNKETLLDLYASQYQMIQSQIRSLQEVQNGLEHMVDGLLGVSYEDDVLKEQMQHTTELIANMRDWKDLWNFDDWAANYDKDILIEGDGLAFYKNYDLVLETTAECVNQWAGEVVEIGIGTGNLTSKILEHKTIKEQQIIGIDQSIQMLKEAKKKHSKILMKVGNFLSLPLKDHCCDIVVSSYAFHHCDEQEKKQAIAEMDRIVRDKGHIIITDLMFESREARQQFASRCSQRELEDLEDEFFANVDELRKIFQECGYLCKSFQIDSLIWMVDACKEDGRNI